MIARIIIGDNCSTIAGFVNLDLSSDWWKFLEGGSIQKLTRQLPYQFLILATFIPFMSNFEGSSL